LLILYILSFIDRQILSLLVGPIRKDLGISDTQMSLLMGFSFALFYTFFGIPLGRLADARSRRTIIAVGVLLWSIMTASCGFVRQYYQLLLCRMGVGVGEAALSPAAYSLITDYFPRHRLATAISVYGMGIYVGSGLAYLLGGYVVQISMGQESVDLPLLGAMRPWQTVFLIVGIPGVLLSLLAYTIAEPARRGKRAASTAGKSHAVALGQVMTYIRQNFSTFFCHNIGFALLALSSYGAASWVPTFFVRVHGWTPSAAGMWYGLIVMLFGSMGIVFGGRLADQLAQKGKIAARMGTGIIAAVAAMPFAIAYPLVPSGPMAMALMVPLVFTLAMPFGAAPAAIQEMMPNSMRGQASAIYLFVVNLIGMGMGPTAVALVTDYVFHDDNAVGYSLLIVGTSTSLVAALLLLAGLKPFVRSMRYLRAWEGEGA
jgi:MFS family permease